MTNPSPQIAVAVSTGRKQFSAKTMLKSGVISTLFLTLIVSNVLSLTHQASHDTGFSLIKSVVEWFTPKDVAVAVLSSSPTVMRDQQIDKATQTLKAERNAIEDKHSKLDAKHRDLEADYKKLDGSHRKLNTDHIQLQQRDKQRTALVQTFVQRIGARQARSAARNVASAPGKTIPIVGALLVAGATAWDLYEACEILGELEQLTTAFGNISNPSQRQNVCGLPVPTEAGLLRLVQSNWQDAYQTSARELQGLPRMPIPSIPQVPTWPQVKQSVCTVTGAVPGICP